MPGIAVRFYGPFIYVAPPRSSHTYRPTLPIPAPSTALGALIARMNEISPIDEKAVVYTGGIKRNDDVAKKRTERLQNKLYIGVSPLPGYLYATGRILRKLLMVLKNEERSNALAHEIAFVPAFDVAIYTEDEELFELASKALRTVTRIGNSESLVTAVRAFDVVKSDSRKAYGVIPARFVENVTELYLMRANVLPLAKLEEELMAFSLTPCEKGTLETKELTLKEPIPQDVLVVEYDGMTVALNRVPSLKKQTQKKGRRS